MVIDVDKMLNDVGYKEEKPKKEKPIEDLKPKPKGRNLKRDFIYGEGRCKYI